MNIATWQDWFTFISLPLAIISLIVTIYYADIKKFSMPFSDKYNNLYGNYKMFNWSRERKNDGENEGFVEWQVTISKRHFKVPKFTMIYDRGNPEWKRHYEGHLLIEGERMFVHVKEILRDYDDPTAIVFLSHGGNKIEMRIGFLCGFRDPVAPCTGVHILCDQKYTKEDAIYVLGDTYDLWYEDFDTRADKVKRTRKTFT